jgi:hypothetical protein
MSCAGDPEVGKHGGAACPDSDRPQWHGISATVAKQLAVPCGVTHFERIVGFDNVEADGSI